MKEGWLERVHPLVKIGGSAVWLTGAVLLSDAVALSIAASGATILLASARPSKRATLGFLVSLLLLALVHRALGGTWAQAAGSAARIYLIVAVSVSLMLTTDPSDLLRSLRRTPLGSSMLLGLALMWRSIPFLKREAEAILLAARLEGKSTSLARPDNLFRYVMVPLAFSMTAYADELAVSLHIRGIDLEKPLRPVLETPRFGGHDITFSATTLLFLGGAMTWSIW
jgi:energy-coupling factor transporter transmembrane protein EcfT